MSGENTQARHHSRRRTLQLRSTNLQRLYLLQLYHRTTQSCESQVRNHSQQSSQKASIRRMSSLWRYTARHQTKTGSQAQRTAYLDHFRAERNQSLGKLSLPQYQSHPTNNLHHHQQSPPPVPTSPRDEQVTAPGLTQPSPQPSGQPHPSSSKNQGYQAGTQHQLRA